jgi:hypothetical protein
VLDAESIFTFQAGYYTKLAKGESNDFRDPPISLKKAEHAIGTRLINCYEKTGLVFIDLQKVQMMSPCYARSLFRSVIDQGKQHSSPNRLVAYNMSKYLHELLDLTLQAEDLMLLVGTPNQTKYTTIGVRLGPGYIKAAEEIAQRAMTAVEMSEVQHIPRTTAHHRLDRLYNVGIASREAIQGTRGYTAQYAVFSKVVDPLPFINFTI